MLLILMQVEEHQLDSSGTNVRHHSNFKFLSFIDKLLLWLNYIGCLQLLS